MPTPTLPTLILAAVRAHPVEAWLALGVVLNLVNASLPATVRTGAFGRALHVLLDRVVILARRDAPGTLKWPIIAGSILRTVADSLSPPEPAAPANVGASREGTPDELARLANGAVIDVGRPSSLPPPPAAPTPPRAAALTGVVPLPPDATQAQYESARQYVAGAAGFDATARQEIAPAVVAEARRLTREGES